MSPKRAEKRSAGTDLKGWTAIAAFLRISAGTAQRWAKDGMPVRREGRLTVADPKELSAWLGREAHMPGSAQIMTANADLAKALKESIAAMGSWKKGCTRLNSSLLLSEGWARWYAIGRKLKT